MARIAVGGFQHETNTFAPTKATYAVFHSGGSWPALCTGDDIAPALRGANIPAGGFLRSAHERGHQIVGLVWCAASPSGPVTHDAFERVMGDMVRRLAEAGPVDAVYLDLHGAMVTEHYDDGEGEILRRVRAVVGERVPVIASLDLHCNFTRAMLTLADGLVAYRTYPHVDQADTGARVARLLEGMLGSGRRPARAMRTFDYLTGLPSQSTLIEPAKRIYGELARIERESAVVLSFTPGFPMADFPECGMAVFGYGDSAERTEQAVERLAQLVREAEPEFNMELLSPDEAVRRAIARGEPGAPVLIADTQDNPGAGGNGDTTGLLAALLRHRAQDAALGLLTDRGSAERAHAIGPGARARFRLGESSGVTGQVPLEGEFLVERIGDGCFTCTGPMFLGFNMKLGPMALLRQEGVRVLLASVKCQAADQEMFRHLGVEPRTQRVIGLKSSVHFRADFQPIARDVLVCAAPGPALADPAEFAWKRLRHGLRLHPLGPAFSGTQ